MVLRGGIWENNKSTKIDQKVRHLGQEMTGKSFLPKIVVHIASTNPRCIAIVVLNTTITTSQPSVAITIYLLSLLCLLTYLLLNAKGHINRDKVGGVASTVDSLR